MSGMVGLVGCGDSDSGGSSGGAGGDTGGGDTGGGTTPAAYQDIDIAKLFTDYENQAGMADDLYKDKNITIVGQVLSVQDLRMVLAIPGENSPVVVVYALSLAGMSGVAGNTVEVQGVCKGMGTGDDNGLIKLTDCSIKIEGETAG